MKHEKNKPEDLSVYGIRSGSTRAEVRSILGQPEGDGFEGWSEFAETVYRPDLDEAPVWIYRERKTVTVFFERDSVVEVWGDSLETAGEPILQSGATLALALETFGLSTEGVEDFDYFHGGYPLPEHGLLLRFWRKDFARLTRKPEDTPFEVNLDWQTSGLVRDLVRQDLVTAVLLAQEKGIASEFSDHYSEGRIGVDCCPALDYDLIWYSHSLFQEEPDTTQIGELFESPWCNIVKSRGHKVFLNLTPRALSKAVSICIQNPQTYGGELLTRRRYLSGDGYRATTIARALAGIHSGEVYRLNSVSDEDCKLAVQHLAQMGRLRAAAGTVSWLSEWCQRHQGGRWVPLFSQHTPTNAMRRATLILRSHREGIEAGNVGSREDIEIVMPLYRCLGKKRYGLSIDSEVSETNIELGASQSFLDFWILQKPRHIDPERGLQLIPSHPYFRVRRALARLKGDATAQLPTEHGASLSREEDLNLARFVEKFPWVLNRTYAEPHRLVAFLSRFSKELLSCLEGDVDLAVLSAAEIVLERGLEMLGVRDGMLKEIS